MLESVLSKGILCVPASGFIRPCCLQDPVTEHQVLSCRMAQLLSILNTGLAAAAPAREADTQHMNEHSRWPLSGVTG